MLRIADRGEPPEDHDDSLQVGKSPDWQSIRLFLEIARSGSFRAAADRLGVSFSVIRRRLESLERELGVLLMTRHTDGIKLTVEGETIFEAARQMEVASFGLLRARGTAIAPAIAGQVTIAVTEGTGTFWIAPRLVELQRAYPKLLVDLKCGMTPADVSSLEADLAIQLVRPSSPDLKVIKVGRIHTMPFAAPSYLEIFGQPKSKEEMGKHRYALYVSDQTQAKKLFNDLFPGKSWTGLVALTANTASAHLWGVSKGVGIGWLPTYAHLIGGRIVPLDVGPRFHFDIWLTYHPDVVKIPRVRRVIDWVKDSFNPKQFPWFGEDFIHPNDLPQNYQGEPLINMFEGFVRHRELHQR